MALFGGRNLIQPARSNACRRSWHRRGMLPYHLTGSVLRLWKTRANFTFSTPPLARNLLTRSFALQVPMPLRNMLFTVAFALVLTVNLWHVTLQPRTVQETSSA